MIFTFCVKNNFFVIGVFRMVVFIGIQFCVSFVFVFSFWNLNVPIFTFLTMNSVHRDIIKSKRDILVKNLSLCKLEKLLKEYKIFNQYMWQDIKSVSDVFDALPNRGPKAYQNMIEILRKAGYPEEAYILENNSLPNEFQNRNLYYKMSSKPLGYCLIINNMRFDSRKRGNLSNDEEVSDEPLHYRHGSDIDAKSLCSFFEGMDFVVTVETNMETKEMKNCIVNFSKRNFMDVDSMILIILSHGGQLNNKDFIYGTDGNYIFKDDIYNIFSNKNCEQLQNKPKVFFFMACRGKRRDYGVPATFPSESVDGNSIMPTLSDIYVFHSSLPYHVSVRDHEKGSFFCQILVSVLKEYYQVYDLETMLKLVNDKLKNKISVIYRIIQVAHIESLGGTKKIMLSGKN